MSKKKKKKNKTLPSVDNTLAYTVNYTPRPKADPNKACPKCGQPLPDES